MADRYICNSCGYKWKSKKNFGNPSICPHCKKGDIIQYIKTKKGKEEYNNEILKYKFVYYGGGGIFLLILILSLKNFNFFSIIAILLGIFFIYKGWKLKKIPD